MQSLQKQYVRFFFTFSIEFRRHSFWPGAVTRKLIGSPSPLFPPKHTNPAVVETIMKANQRPGEQFSL